MIDMHSHILPNIDDGAKNIEITCNLIKEAKKAGFEGIVATSHYMEGYYEAEEEERKQYIEIISKELQKELDVKIYLGNEIYFSENIPNLIKERKSSSINGSKYVLFELPLNTKPLNMYDAVYKMQQDGLIPILAHPERYLFVQEEPKLVYELINEGVLIQANYGSIIGQYGKRAEIIVKNFFRNNMIHFLGTDVHKENTIYPEIPQILNILNRLIGKEKVNILTNVNPKLVLDNKEIQIFEPNDIGLNIKDKIIMKLK